jgi:hypothetical protein
LYIAGRDNAQGAIGLPGLEGCIRQSVALGGPL